MLNISAFLFFVKFLESTKFKTSKLWSDFQADETWTTTGTLFTSEI